MSLVSIHVQCTGQLHIPIQLLLDNIMSTVNLSEDKMLTVLYYSILHVY